MPRLACALVALALGLAACGEDEQTSTITDPLPGSQPPPAAAPAETETTETTAEAEGGPLDDLDQKPAVEAGEGEPPEKLVKEDIVEGDGETAKKGDTVSVQYVGVLYEDGTQFDASWDSGQPFEFELGAGNVIQGWDRGIPGMKVGGRRKLVIPADLAYGEQGAGGSIPPGAALIFVVDLLEIK